MVEGKGSKDFSRIKTLIFDQPETANLLLKTITEAVIAYLGAQRAAGAQALMVFDTWGGALSRRDYEHFSLRYMGEIVAGLEKTLNGDKPPVILFTKGGGQWLESIAATGCDAVGLDWTVDIHHARQRIGNTVALQGNMDPNMLYASPDRITREVATILDQYGDGSGHVFNLGHGIHPGIDPENVRTLVDAVHELSTRYHR